MGRKTRREEKKEGEKWGRHKASIYQGKVSQMINMSACRAKQTNTKVKAAKGTERI